MLNPVGRSIPYLLAIGSGLIWGSTFSLARLATEGGAHPLGLALWQAAGGSGVLMLVCLFSGHWPSFSLDSLRRMLIIGLLGTSIPGTMLFYAAPHVPAGVLAITMALVPILTYAVSALVGLDRLSWIRGSGILAGFAAVLLISVPDSSLPSATALGWLMLALASTLFYTAENLYVDKFVPAGTRMTGLLMGSMFMAALLLYPLVWWQDAFFAVSLPLDVIDGSVLAMAVVSSVAYLMYLYLISVSGAVFASMSGYVVTLSGVFWAIAIFGEQHSWWVWAALVLMCAGLGLVTPRDDKRASPTQ
jgi:drug/metabolite transporter (DMT)-like permease